MSKVFRSALALFVIALSLGSDSARATAFTIDLTDTAASVTINGALFNYDNINSGSGTYTRMFAIQANGTESGYNFAGANPLPFDQKGGSFLPNQNLGDIPVVTIGGQQYLQFVFDANDAAPLTMTDFRVFIDNTTLPNNGTVKITNEANIGDLGTLVYDFNAGGPNTLEMTAFEAGSGTDDLSINIPLANFLPFFGQNGADVYVFMKFTGGDSGFEELAIDRSITTTFSTLVPEANTIWGGATMIALLGCMRFRRPFGRSAAALN
jgi:hypothetical protein